MQIREEFIRSVLTGQLSVTGNNFRNLSTMQFYRSLCRLWQYRCYQLVTLACNGVKGLASTLKNYGTLNSITFYIFIVTA